MQNESKLSPQDAQLLETLLQASKLGHNHPVWVEFRRRSKSGEFRQDFEDWAAEEWEGWDGSDEQRAVAWFEFNTLDR